MDKVACARLIHTLFAMLKSGGVHYAPLERTFRLYAGSSLYAFRVDDLGQLEHLYWGEAIPLTQDLAYCINTQLTFETTPVHPHSSASDNPSSQQHLLSPVKDLIKAAGARTAEKTWRKYRGGKVDSKNDVYRRRIENASWRLWHIRDVAPTYQVVKLRHRAAGFLLQKPIGDDTDGDADADKPMMVRRPHAKTHLDLTSLDVEPHTPLPSANGDVVGKGSLKLEYSDFGTGDFRPPAFSIEYEADGSGISPCATLSIRS